jgi:transglutaminase-like putative cysteine protease
MVRRFAQVLIVTVMMVAVVLSGCLGSVGSSGWTEEDLVIPTYMIEENPSPVLPTPNSPASFLYSYRLMWTMSQVYSTYGGLTNVTLENTGDTTIFVYRFGINWVNHTISSTRETSSYVEPGESGELGTLFFVAPEGVREEYEVRVWISVSNRFGTLWHDYGEMVGANRSTEIEPGASSPLEYSVQRNPGSYFGKVNNRIDFEAVGEVASLIQAGFYPDESINQIVGAYEWVSGNIVYTVDQGGDHWQSAHETLEKGTGDCEDQAILIASIFGALGLNGRVNIIDQHAFASVYVSDNVTKMGVIQEVIESMYHSELPVCYLQDEMGYWLVTDTTGFFYAGGMPARALPIEGGGWSDWTFESTQSLVTVDAVGPSSGWELPF